MPHVSNRRNVTLLAICQGIFICGQTTLILMGGLVGYTLAEDKALATLPISAVILGNALMTIPASLIMRRVGRRAGFMGAALTGVLGMLLSAYALQQQMFWLFVASAALVGCYNAFCQYYRFAAADASEPRFKARAISLVLAGGVIAGVVGPQLAIQSRDLLAPVAFLGSYLLLAGLTLTAFLLLAFLNIPPLTEEERSSSGRPLTTIMRQPRFIAAVGSAMIAYGVMSLLMTATPLAMIACGFPDRDAGFVIQWHVIGMFLPSFFTGSLIARFGLYPVMLAGAVLLAVCVAISLSGITFVHFSVSLLLLGVGWNFLFVGATTLLTDIHTPSERAKTQAANDFLVFATTATASFLSGSLLHAFGWDTINAVAIPFVALAFAVTASLAITAMRTKQAG